MLYQNERKTTMMLGALIAAAGLTVAPLSAQMGQNRETQQDQRAQYGQQRDQKHMQHSQHGREDVKLKNQYTFRVKTGDAQTFSEGDPVTYRGTRVGEVSTISEGSSAGDRLAVVRIDKEHIERMKNTQNTAKLQVNGTELTDRAPQRGDRDYLVAYMYALQRDVESAQNQHDQKMRDRGQNQDRTTSQNADRQRDKVHIDFTEEGVAFVNRDENIYGNTVGPDNVGAKETKADHLPSEHAGDTRPIDTATNAYNNGGNTGEENAAYLNRQDELDNEGETSQRTMTGDRTGNPEVAIADRYAADASMSEKRTDRIEDYVDEMEGETDWSGAPVEEERWDQAEDLADYYEDRADWRDATTSWDQFEANVEGWFEGGYAAAGDAWEDTEAWAEGASRDVAQTADTAWDRGGEYAENAVDQTGEAINTAWDATGEYLEEGADETGEAIASIGEEGDASWGDREDTMTGSGVGTAAGGSTLQGQLRNLDRWFGTYEFDGQRETRADAMQNRIDGLLNELQNNGGLNNAIREDLNTLLRDTRDFAMNLRQNGEEDRARELVTTANILRQDLAQMSGNRQQDGSS